MGSKPRRGEGKEGGIGESRILLSCKDPRRQPPVSGNRPLGVTSIMIGWLQENSYI